MPTLEAVSQKSIAFKHILVATDFADASERALDFAVAVARRYVAKLSVVHAIPGEPHDRIPIDLIPPELDRRGLEAEGQLKHLEDEFRLDGIDYKLILERGNVWDVIAADIQRENIDLLVLGTRGRGGLRKLALGSVAEQVLRMARCPVLTVGPKVTAALSGAMAFKRILFATDFGPASECAFPYALSMAMDYEAKLFMLHMLSPMPAGDLGPAAYGPSAYAADDFTNWQRTMRDRSIKKLEKLIPDDARLSVEPNYLVSTDYPAEGILDAAARNDVQLIVLGTNRTALPRVAAHMPWVLTHEVICGAHCPVLTICR